jgi:hypothetical protein
MFGQSVIAFALCLLGAAALAADPASDQRLDAVAHRGAHVMPFDLERTTHVFESTGDGGVQVVRAKDPADAAQVALIRAHLAEIAADFARGDFSAPIAIHGEDMPGVAELRAGAARVRVEYAERPDGARIRYASADPELVDAIHRWFAAQLSDHARHAHAHER